ncbi:hypothetical protein CDD83_5405 [Cordyceps sp. RAO-2017]|nr:hypothetical protein CDD83_5405 [Cordyceps sp. RAO-2017]
MSSTSSAAHTLHPDHISPRHVTFLAVASTLTALATTCTVLRFVQRLSIGFWWDDWFILAASAFAIGSLVTIILSATVVHAGYHFAEYAISEINIFMKIALANNIIYNASISFSKASVIYFYYRIFGTYRALRLQLRIVSGLVALNFLAAVLGLVFATSPVRAQWDILVPHTTIHNKAFWSSMAIINISLDIVILAIPQARVWRLTLSFRRRVLVSLVFLLGAFVIIASCVRIIYMLTIDVNDVTCETSLTLSPTSRNVEACY